MPRFEGRLDLNLKECINLNIINEIQPCSQSYKRDLNNVYF